MKNKTKPKALKELTKYPYIFLSAFGGGIKPLSKDFKPALLTVEASSAEAVIKAVICNAIAVIASLESEDKSMKPTGSRCLELAKKFNAL